MLLVYFNSTPVETLYYSSYKGIEGGVVLALLNIDCRSRSDLETGLERQTNLNPSLGSLNASPTVQIP